MSLVIVYPSEHLKVTVTKDKDTDNLSKLFISTALVVNHLPQREAQLTITKVFKHFFWRMQDHQHQY